MYKALLFDLDGTLVGLDTKTFLEHYLKAVTHHMSEHIPPQHFTANLMAATYDMTSDTREDMTNQEKFFEHFANRLEREDVRELLPHFDEFYLNHFGKLRYCAQPVDDVCDVLDWAVARKMQLVVATNPLFPRQAIYERLKWAGVENYPFNLITTYENMHFAKPQLAYYQEILDRIGRCPRECLMVGNDTYEDMVAQQVGMETFLCDRFVVTHPGKCLEPHYRGSFADLLNILKEKMGEG